MQQPELTGESGVLGSITHEDRSSGVKAVPADHQDAKSRKRFAAPAPRRTGAVRTIGEIEINADPGARDPVVRARADSETRPLVERR